MDAIMQNMNDAALGNEPLSGIAEGAAASKNVSEDVEERSSAQLLGLKHRLSRIEGQIRGLNGMLDRELRCTEILVQSSAVIAAMRGFEREIVSQHLRGHVAPAIRAGDDRAIDDFADCLRRSLR